MSSAAERLSRIANQFSANRTPVIHQRKDDNDVVIVSALRTPITRAKKGGFKDTPVEELLTAVLKATLQRTRINPSLVEDVAIGTVLSPGGGAVVGRMACLAAGLPESTSMMTLNRQCSSGLQAVAQIASAIQSGLIEIGIGAGVDSMTLNYGPAALPGKVSESVVKACPAASDCLLPMGITSENVATQFGITRAEQDMFSSLSHEKASRAQQQGLFDDEIIPVRTRWVDPETKIAKEIVVSRDDGVRNGVTPETLSKLKPSFKKDGSTTAGNASQVSDGAAAVLLMKRTTANRLGLPILGRFVTAAVAGVPPKIMGIGPTYAIPLALQKASMDLSQIDIIELNEAFASQAVYSIKKLGIDMNKVNPKGGAIALGHPLGCTGARQVATLLTELKRQDKRNGIVSMCIGTGMGMCGIFEREL